MRDVLLVTPSYAPDFERCKLMVESADRFVTDIQRHVLLIDNSDLPLFSTIKSDRVELVTKESLLPWWVRRMPGASRWWLSLGSLPVRGWIMQQVMKLAMAERYQSDAIWFADSDLVFVRPFSAPDIYQGESLRLWRGERGPHQRADRRYRNWYAMAARVCGLADPDAINGSYIAQLTSWRHENIVQLYRQIENGGSNGWLVRLLRHLDFSEFVLYGVFAEHCLAGQHGHYLDEKNLCHSSWFFDVQTPEDVSSFVNQMSPHQVAVHLQSNLGMSADMLDAIVAPPAFA